MWHYERFDYCRRLITYQDNYTGIPQFDRLVRTWRLQVQTFVKDVWCEI